MTLLIINNYQKNANTENPPILQKAFSAYPVEMIHFSEITPNYQVPSDITGIILSGSITRFHEHGEYHRSQVQLIQTTPLPVLGICYGHQLIGKIYGSPINTRPEGTITGIQPITIVKKDPLVAGWKVGEQAYFTEWHEDYIVSLPPTLELIGSSAECTNEIIRHKQRLLWGVQFHPEYTFDPNTNEKTLDGQKLVKNFITIVKNNTK